MAEIIVNFTFHSGVKRQLFRNVRLSGSWDTAGRFSNQWTEVPMAASQDGTGCDTFSASVSFDAAQKGTTFQWGVIADIAGAPNTWVVVTEVPDENSSQRYRSFVSRRGRNAARLLVRNWTPIRRAEMASAGIGEARHTICCVGAACQQGRSSVRAVQSVNRHADRLYR